MKLLSRSAPYVVLLVWFALQWSIARPPAAAADWMGWRQADTQAIALNFRDSGNDILHPQIDWRGDGPGFVETEFQLYPWLIKLLLPAQGNAEWPGQLVSLVSMTLAVALIFLTLRRACSPPSAALAALMALTSLGNLQLATAIQPDALCFAFYVASLACFYRYLQDGATHWLWGATLLALPAVLIKPTALHIGIVQFTALALGARPRLRSPAPWLCWLLILASVALFVGLAHRHYVEHGNTFGIGLGGDRKWPGLRELLHPLSYYTLLRQSMTWGIGIAGTLAGVWLLARRRLTTWEWALIAGNIAHLTVSMRYSSSMWLGSHYHIFGLFLGCWLFAHAVHDALPAVRQRRAALAAITALLLLQGAYAIYQRIHHDGVEDGQRFLALTAIARQHVATNDLIVVRSSAEAQIEGWGGGTNNFEDPRLFYLTATKGWVLALNDDNVAALADVARRGARYYLHMGSFTRLPATQRWLQDNATLLDQNRYGAVYALQPASPPSDTLETEAVISVE